MISLIILAAGMGTRYGQGVKQFTSITENGTKTLLHCSLENAENYFHEYIFVIRKEIRALFQKLFSSFLRTHKCNIVYQEVPIHRQ